MTLDTFAGPEAPTVASSPTEATSDAIRVPVSEIHVLDGHNPRRFFADAPFQRLKESIASHGLVTPLTVRPRAEGGYWLIAGERRLRCVRDLAIASVPVLVRDVSEAEARMLAVVENADRHDLSIADEILSIQSLLDAYEGDVAGVAAALGWKEERVKHRLKLMQAAPEVVEALANEQIRLGHCELLASLPQEAQPKVLAKVIETGASVADLKAQLETFAMPLTRAIFDKADCRLCPFNSSCQRGLFADSVAEDKCTNRVCYNEKTQAALDAKREEAKQGYATVAYASQIAPGTTIPLTVEGKGSVTPEQLKACTGCKHFGVSIEDRQGASIGAVSPATCFNVACHKTKVAEAEEARRPKPVEPEAPSPVAPSSTATSAPQTPKAASKPAAPAKPATVAAVPKAVEIAVDRMQREAVQASLGQHPSLLLAFAVYGLHRTRKSDGDTSKNNPLSRLKISTDADDTKVILKLAAMEPALLKQALLESSAALIGDFVDAPQQTYATLNRRKLSAKLATAFNVDVAPFVKVDKAFLEAHTKAGIEAVLDESGFAAWFREKEGDKGDKAFRALLGKGKGDVIDGVLAAGFDFSGYIPSSLKALS